MKAMTIERQMQAIDIIRENHLSATFKMNSESRILIAANLHSVLDTELRELFKKGYVVNIFRDVESQDGFVNAMAMWII